MNLNEDNEAARQALIQRHANAVCTLMNIEDYCHEVLDGKVRGMKTSQGAAAVIQAYITEWKMEIKIDVD